MTPEDFPRLFAAAFAARDPKVTYIDAQAPLCRAGHCLLLQDGALNY